MPRYHFDITDQGSKPNTVGMDFPDWQSAQREAIRLAGEMIIAGSARDQVIDDWSMSVTDGGGLILFRLDFVVGNASVLVQAGTHRNTLSNSDRQQGA